ncbi:glycogen debranching protein [Candidatus Fermentibacteria bacterium]|nr:glycogen debranching protein [Candidatus Fermentibacteria bacterium]
MRQIPAPGSRLISHSGDLIRFELTTGSDSGRAYLRTNLGHADVRWTEIVERVEDGSPRLYQDWHDVPMEAKGNGRFALTLPLLEVGRFEAKAFVVPEDSDQPVWPEGENVVLKVEPAEYCSANSFYTSFVRQMGRDRSQSGSDPSSRAAALQREGYAVIPPSGTFRDLIGALDHIVGDLGCRIIQLLPIHPIPTTYARMGSFGSPFAVLDFRDVDPSMAEFDRRTTPLEQFAELVDAVHSRGAKLFLDLPINHTGWASKLQIDHPEWFVRGADRTFESPGAWGVTWEDLARLDYSHQELWSYMADVFLFWCDRGVDGFRCDAGYMVPCPAWKYLVAKVRLRYPDTVFVLEGLGGRKAVQDRLLDEADLDWAYSELFQNYDRDQVEAYLPGCLETSMHLGNLVHFAETHDNNRLAATSPSFARMRTAVTALCSIEGAFGITNGVEWLATEKVDVHGCPPLNWGSESNQVEWIARLNRILRVHPAFHAGGRPEIVTRGGGNALAVLRISAGQEKPLLVLANLSHDREEEVHWDHPADLYPGVLYDLLSERKVRLPEGLEPAMVRLRPGEVLCLTPEKELLRLLEDSPRHDRNVPERIRKQALRKKALEVLTHYRSETDLEEEDSDAAAREMGRNPRRFCRRASGGEPVPLVPWRWPEDTGRVVMVPPGCLLYARADYRFSLRLETQGKTGSTERSIQAEEGYHFVLLRPPPAAESHVRCRLDLTVHRPDRTVHSKSNLLVLAEATPPIRTSFDRREVEELGIYAISTNGLGGMAQVRGSWGEIRSQYDALLAANPEPDFPSDRTVMLTRIRTWLVWRDYSRPIDVHCLRSFHGEPGGEVSWRFLVPVGQGRTVSLTIRVAMIYGQNATRISLRRECSAEDAVDLPSEVPVRLIVRPDVEMRTNHEKTKAYAGPEQSWPPSVTPTGNGFVFSPGKNERLEVTAYNAEYVHQPEWTYMVGHPLDAERGLGDSSDLFSPGYLTTTMNGGGEMIITASAPGSESGVSPQDGRSDHPVEPSLKETLRLAMDDFVVRRGGGHAVIAGYPWFLDWGRDTLVFLRGMVAAGMIERAQGILECLAGFERSGTLPNMIRGEDDSNRDTSDAPLWLFVACSDLLDFGVDDLPESDCGGRTMRDVMLSIGRNYVDGTPNGIRMDPESGLIHSPAHFTWMDTDHPPGTPREGYPVEIQALWYHALRLLARLDDDPEWNRLADKVKSSIHRYFVRRLSGETGAEWLSDCLHCGPGCPAEKADADDHLRPNQLFAVTMGAVDDPSLCGQILWSCGELLVPGGLRSLADRPVSYELPITLGGKPLNDPLRPYQGRYLGEDDTGRKPAYHNGTAWTWLLPSYVEALYLTYGGKVREKALALLGSCTEVIDRGCVGQVPEILDGDDPHHLRGCGAQAWGCSETLRVLIFLKDS